MYIFLINREFLEFHPISQFNWLKKLLSRFPLNFASTPVGPPTGFVTPTHSERGGRAVWPQINQTQFSTLVSPKKLCSAY